MPSSSSPQETHEAVFIGLPVCFCTFISSWVLTSTPHPPLLHVMPCTCQMLFRTSEMQLLFSQLTPEPALPNSSLHFFICAIF